MFWKQSICCGMMRACSNRTISGKKCPCLIQWSGMYPKATYKFNHWQWPSLLNAVDRIADPGYRPTKADWLSFGKVTEKTSTKKIQFSHLTFRYDWRGRILFPIINLGIELTKLPELLREKMISLTIGAILVSLTRSYLSSVSRWPNMINMLLIIRL